VHRRKFSHYGKLSTDRRTLFYELSRPNTMVLEDTRSGRELLRIPQPDSWSGGYALAPDSQTLVTTTYSAEGESPRYDRHAVRFWEQATGKECLTIQLSQSGYEFSNHGLRFSPDGRLLAGLRRDHLLQVWDAARGQELWRCQGPAEPTHALVFAPDGKSLITGLEDSTILVEVAR
jgi:WD40 repeat protein